MKTLAVILGSVFLVSACGNKGDRKSDELIAIDSKNNLEIKITKTDHGGATNLRSKVYRNDELIDSSEWMLPGEVVKMQVLDIDENGVDELFVVPIKTTKYDTVPRQRPFFFKLQKGHIVPLWLGSRLSRPMVDVNLIETDQGPRLRSIEEDSVDYLVADYKWKGFGVQFDRYLSRSTDLFSALNQLYSDSN